MLLVSTYELGRQPVHLASPMASLRAAGHEVRPVDLAVDGLRAEDVSWAEGVAISVPMHTATRLADEVARALAEARPELPVVLYGLYAGVAAADVDARLVGEYEPALLRWSEGIGRSGVHLGRSDFAVPDRSGLPDLSNYARLERSGTSVMAGAVEASHGCRHRCRHCPIPAVYDGRIRVVPREQVLADIDNLVVAGAEHITFADADFLNAPPHSLAILEEAHEAHPGVTFDATTKVEHIVEHAGLWPELAELNLAFVVSAFESVDGRTLEILDKGHGVADMAEAIRLTRESGIHIRPTWLPFMPWTTPGDIADIFEFLSSHDLASATDPVQLAIKLLVPKGSLLESHPSLEPHLDGYDHSALTWRWEFTHPGTAALQGELESIAAGASDCGQELAVTLEEMRQAVERLSSRRLPALEPTSDVPRLTESWFCCAEPTGSQLVSLAMPGRG